jgi:hypothetical protein
MSFMLRADVKMMNVISSFVGNADVMFSGFSWWIFESRKCYNQEAHTK